jgi:hypothetical protein
MLRTVRNSPVAIIAAASYIGSRNESLPVAAGAAGCLISILEGRIAAP